MNFFSRLKSCFSLSLTDKPDKEATRAAVVPARNPQCSEFEVDGWMLSGFFCEQLVPIVGFHPFPIRELMLMCAAVTRLKPSLIFEWSTIIERFARIFCEISHYYGLNTVVDPIDLLDDIEHGEHSQASRAYLDRDIPAVHLHQEDGLTTPLKLLRDAASPSESLFFIDGDYGYESVKRELEGVMASVPKPSLLLHDTFFQSSESGYSISLHQALEEILAKFPSRFSVVKTGMRLPDMTQLISS